MGFKKKRYTNIKDGVQVRALGLDIIDLSSDTEGRGLVVFTDKQNSVHMAMESTEFAEAFVEGWKTGVELGLVDVVEETEASTFIEKVQGVVDGAVDIVKEVASDIHDIAEDVGEATDEIAEVLVETAEDIAYIVTTNSEDEVKATPKKKATTKKKKVTTEE